MWELENTPARPEPAKGTGKERENTPARQEPAKGTGMEFENTPVQPEPASGTGRSLEKVVIRRMTAEDISRVLVVERACFSKPWSAEVFSATLLLPYAHYFVAEVKEDDGALRIIGECGVRDIVGEGEITNVAVHPDWQGLGVAGKMLGTVLKESLEQGMTAFTLEVRAGNRPAIALYRKYGFHTEGIRTGFYDKPVEDALIMWRRKI